MTTINQAYHYKTGDRPLEGFTIQRGVGRGAFGEVYYALSDSGREVGLKSVLGYEQIELRGVTQCMNLKSPYLVSIFDIRQNERGQSFVIMEYVAGASLRDLLNDSPSGLGPQKTAFFLREIAKGLAYLHERGIVHRDLKPGNIFYEDGYVKIGDYGLSKAIAPSQHSGQTITVGTVHYMAPEIGQGRYDKSIDIYALGVLVFEMLTGHVPFFGASHGEILMKHLMETPDVGDIEEPFATVIKKAMAKNPADRYQTVQEMVEAVFGAEHIAQSVSVFRPESLSIVAERAARKMVAAGGPGSSAELPNSLRVDAPAGDSSDVWLDLGRKVEHVTERLQQAGERFASKGRLAAERPDTARHRGGDHAIGGDAPAADVLVRDPMTRRQRRILAIATAGVMALGTGFLSGSSPDVITIAVFLAIMGGGTGLVIAHRRLLPKHDPGGAARHLIMAVPGFLGALVLGGLVLAEARASDDMLAATWFAAGVSFLFVPWDKIMSSSRQERVTLGQAMFAGGVAFALGLVFGGLQIVAMGMMAGIALVAQIASPFARTARVSTSADAAPGIQRRRTSAGPAPVPPPLPASHSRPAEGWQRRLRDHGGPHDAGVDAFELPVPLGIRITWLCVLVTTLGLALFCAIATGFVHSRDFVYALGGAVAFGIGALSSLIQLRKRAYYGWWGSLVKPLLRTVSLAVPVFSGFALSEARPGSDDALACAFFIGFPAAIWLALWFIPNDLFGPIRPATSKSASTSAGEPEIDRTTGIILTCLGLFGLFGLQRLCVGKIWTGLLYFFTGGLLLIGQIYDLLMLASGEFTDKHGRKLRDKNQYALAPPAVAPANVPAANVPVAVPVGDPASSAAPQPANARLLGTDRLSGPAAESPSRTQMYSSSPRQVREPKRTSLVLSALAYAVLIPAVLLGGAAVLQVPAFVAITIPDLGQEISRDLGPNWPMMSMRIGIAIASIMLVLAALTLVVARREAGGAHMARAVLGVVGLFITGVICQEMLAHIPWLELITEPRDVIRIETALNNIDSSAAFAAMLALLVSGVILAWPERRATIALDASVREGVAA